MIRTWYKLVIIVFIVFSLFTCIDPYIPKLTGYESLFVVEGLITDENSAYTVKLSESILNTDVSPSLISDAIVSIYDEESVITNLTNFGNGKYKTDSTEFRGKVGKTYILHIETKDGNIYESEPYTMLPVPEIDSIYFEKDQKLINNGTETSTGIQIYLDSKEEVSNNYYRWDFDETWKFKVPTPKKSVYINENLIINATDVHEYCYKSNKSKEILIYSAFEGRSEIVKKEPILFIDPEKTDRLMLQYSMLVKQYSVSDKEYEFWYNMKQINEKGGDIFSLQPFPVVSNVHSVINPDEMVLGFFQVSAVKQKRKDIPFREIVGLNLPFYHYQCIRWEREPRDYAFGYGPPPTWDDIYKMFCITSDYIFVEPKYKPGTYILEKMVFTRKECADCEVTGTSNKPDFWKDL